MSWFDIINSNIQLTAMGTTFAGYQSNFKFDNVWNSDSSNLSSLDLSLINPFENKCTSFNPMGKSFSVFDNISCVNPLGTSFPVFEKFSFENNAKNTNIHNSLTSLSLNEFKSDLNDRDINVYNADINNLNPKFMKKVDKLTEIANQMGVSFTISSGYRDEERNKKAGGVSNSQHLLGMAIDICNIKGDKKAFLEKAKEMNFFILESGSHNGNCFHLDGRNIC